MKQLFIFAFLLVPGSVIFAQGSVKTTSAKPVLKNMTDSFSYGLGVQVAGYYRRMGVKKINSTVLAKAISDVYANGKLLLSQKDMDLAMMAITSPEEFKKIKPTIDAGEKFLSENKKRAGVKTTTSGLQYEVITEGTGAKPTAVDSVTCNYKGTLLNGTEFDNSYSRGQPMTFSLQRVIPGWTEGLQLMTIGSKYKFYIPYTLGFGPVDDRSIPGGSTLIFEVELLDIKKVNPGQ